MYPIATTALPDSADTMFADELALFESDYDTYFAQKVDILAVLQDGDWRPTLSQLDNIITSLQLSE